MRLSRVKFPAYGHAAHWGLEARCVWPSSKLKFSNNQLSRDPGPEALKDGERATSFSSACPASISPGPRAKDLQPDQAAVQYLGAQIAGEFGQYGARLQLQNLVGLSST